ncbi:MAG TPA: hypothetical protein VKX17_01220 [Planctomycetota bacterium]|nr:hypothetical protein [Planctomycetota bacterium]
MRMLKYVFPLMLAFGFTMTAFAADKPADEKPQDQTGSISGTIMMPSKEAPKGCVAELHQPQPGAAKGEETVFYLFADGKESRQLKDIANKGGMATVTGIVSEKGYKVTSVSKGGGK